MNELILDNRIMPVVKSAGNISVTCSSISEYITSRYNSFYIIVYGECVVTEDGIPYNAVSGSALFIKKNAAIDISCNPAYPDNITLYYYYFDMNVNKEDSHPGRYIIPKFMDDISGSILYEKAERYIELFNSESSYPLLDINSKFYDILSECVKYNIDYRHSQNNLSENIIIFLNDHINEQLNTKDMEKKFFLTYKYMGTIFKKETGYTILNYHTLLRIESAKKMLVSTLYSIDEISRELGYSDPLYFSRVFKKTAGQSPLAYRKQHVSNAKP